MLEKVVTSLSRNWESTEAKAVMAFTALAGAIGASEETIEAAQNPFRMDSRAQGGASRATNLVVGLVVAGLMAAFLLPIAIDEIEDVDTADWSNGADSLWGVLPIMIVLAIFLFFVGLALQNQR